ncbi:cobalt ABC transporter, inner membrane subunit CbiQ [Desulfobulbus propionicus DSM 2032]|uniref:Cobalt ABC transporter, inner membrane subunit CbiQ n=1 Tax=Desulfobulbus propionicus (strain ATCC 33891 / DSM 2032 / VKM B-1956 / 1pr3) TaxID=577650 RepID=A0A7U3YPV9_DESPD|nr:cobalt ECF transporter T component CbiQ [Desulfobulbus propionicus]ADW19360.1 cobalt ABC transporter, inner membrane subunit CbiQ [Desulfobulbus propionicus DSM 2032]
MAKIESAFVDLSALDALAAGDSSIHRLDPRIKVLIAALFVLCVVSFDKYTVAALAPFALCLSLIMALGRVPASLILTRLVLVSPFAVLLGLCNPLLDQHPQLYLGSFAVSGGWLSFCSILLRFSLTIGALLVLIATTGFNAVCMALERLGMPTVFAVQLLLLYRYLFVLIEEGRRMHRARALRSFQGRGMGMRTYGHLLGGLLLRTLDRAQRIHQAMLCRGFDGTVRTRRPPRLTLRDVVVFMLAGLVLIGLRRYDCSLLLGRLLTGALP